VISSFFYLQHFYFHKTNKFPVIQSALQFFFDHKVKQISANKLEDYVVENLKRISLDNNYIESSIFKLNFDHSGDLKGYEPSRIDLLKCGFWGYKTGL